MPVPQVVIVGRPNVGKSSILNWLAGKRISVVDPTPGVTRDRVKYLMHEKDRYFELVDTGGMGIVDNDDLSDEIEEQIRIGVDEADLILFVLDGLTGVVPLDVEVGERLRHVDKPIVMVVNKCDSTKTDREIAEFYKLSRSPIMTTSVKGNRNRAELIATILEHLPPAEAFEESEGARGDTEPELKLAIVGRRNVGKSTFINVLAKSPRVITSEVPGTTRDSIDIRFDMDDKVFVAIDTPGVRKRKSMSSDIEYYGLVRAKRSIRRANVVMMFFDSQETISRVDKQLVEEIVKHHKPCVFVVNKWDLAVDAEMTIEKWSDYLLKSFSTMRHAPVAFITAIDDHNTKQLINLTQTIFKQARERVGTPRLNKIIRAAMLNNMPPMRKNRRPKIYYATQVSVEPPTIVLKCNEPGLFDPSWKRYLLGVLREETPFQEVPIQLYMRAKVRSDGPAKSLEEEELDPFDESSDANIVSDTLSY